MLEELEVLKIVSERLESARLPFMRAMNDTSPEFEAMLDERYRRMTPDERVRIAASMYDTARAIVLSSLSPELSRRERRLAFARRFYEGELPEAALIAYAEWDGEAESVGRPG